MNIQREKISQAKKILEEEKCDLWLTIGRETSMNSDPIIPLVSGNEFGGMSALLITKEEAVILASTLDALGFKQKECFDKVIDYQNDFETAFLENLKKINPKSIAINYSTSNVAADGLSHGMYLYLVDFLNKNNLNYNLISSEKIIAKLRGRKSPGEIGLLEEASRKTMIILREVKDFIKEGVSQKDIWKFCQDRIEFYNVGQGWEKSQNPGVFIGPNPVIGHAGPGDRKVKKGELINLDFGIRVNGYCSDIQRTYYLLEDGETDIPEIYKKHFKNLQNAIDEAMKLMKPGVCGRIPHEKVYNGLLEMGYKKEEIMRFGFGHQIGQYAHDGGVSMGRRTKDNELLDDNMTITVDSNLWLDRGRIGQEDVAIVTPNGAKFLSERQTEIWLCKCK